MDHIINVGGIWPLEVYLRDQDFHQIGEYCAES